MKRQLNAKKMLSTVLAAVIMFSMFANVTASGNNVDVDKTAVYSNGKFDGKSAIVNGDIYAANGNVEFNNAGDNVVSGNIYINKTANFVIPQWYSPDFSKRVIKLDSTTFNAPEKSFMTAPVIENYVASFSAVKSSVAVPITQDTRYGTLKIESDNVLKVDVSTGDRYIVADSFKFVGNSSIELIGNGRLFLFINNDLSVSGSPKIKNNNNSSSTHIFANGNVELKDTSFYANIYAKGNKVTVDNGFTLNGNIVSNNAKTINILGNAKIYGVVYAPSADASLSNSGTVYGRLIANTATLFGRGTVNYDERYATLNMPAPAVTKFSVTIGINLADAGTVTPNNIEVTKGETIKISAVANPGYEFIGFTTSDSSPIPDANGNITVTKDIHLTANFKQKVQEPAPPVDIPDGPSLLIHFPYAYLYGNEDGTAGAEDSIKREEAAALIYRLLKQDNKIGNFSHSSVEPYVNIETNRWSRSALEFMKYIGVYKTNYISPQAYITRGEVAKIVCFALRIRPDDSKFVNYNDLSVANQSYNYIKALSDIGVLQGYNGNIEPDKEMSRAEFVAMVNRLIGRDDEHEIIDSMNPYSDLSKSEWYYEDMMRASFGYFDSKDNGIYKIDPSKKPNRYTIDYN